MALADDTVPVTARTTRPRADRLDPAPICPALDALRELARAGSSATRRGSRQRDGRPEVDGDPTEGALIVLALRAGLDPAETGPDCPRLDLLPFAAETRLMATLHATAEQGAVICLKGAPEVVLPRWRPSSRGWPAPARARGLARAA